MPRREDPEAIPTMVFGHEFCAEVLEHGPDTDRHVPVGSLVCSVPFVEGVEGPELVGLTRTSRVASAEQMVLQEHRLLVVPERAGGDERGGHRTARRRRARRRRRRA